MMTVHTPLHLRDPDATDAFARWLGGRLGAGDVVLLEGQIGAGKTHLARALIQSLLPSPEDVPSPTYTLVQVYDGPGFAIWHADLYRLSDADEAIELGLTDAFDTALCLVEWPEKLGRDRPKKALTLRFSVIEGHARHVDLLSDDPAWTQRLEGWRNV